ncbi:alkaline phosphatase [Sphingomonas mucosissima]|uniref:Alkaline phosphatase n=1 Tax=Sphingomonas mucosissima TaxID=370959 RepID=A0A245ZJK2_9SPHN|nr:alkaline phosphatase [Sphingomonas mucosissima]OWK29932.1 alkaline phosphatase precursor [Sphingomonas mucosissima]
MFARLALVAVLACTCHSALAQEGGPDLSRAARGDLREPGGARRLKGDMRDQYARLSVRGDVRNVILLIGDGMGDSEITIARNYSEGAGGYFKGIDALPFTGQYTHYALDRETGKPDYVTDSAASATAWASGVKTYNGAIGVDIAGRPHRTLLERAKARGLATGDVSTAEIQDATPGALLAHVTHRSCYTPATTLKTCPQNALENGGAGSITEQLLDTRADLVLGGGAASFAAVATAGKWKGMTLSQQALARGYRFVRNASELETVTRADDGAPVIGIFSEGHMPVRWTGPKASYHGNIDKPAITCAANPARNANIPTLAAMTQKAIALLKGNRKGFFLQVEGASIDKQDHAANPCGQIGETVDLDEAVQVAMAFAKADRHTLVIVTSDHAHTSQIIGNGTRAPGLTATLRTREGGLMTVNYGTAEEGSQGHTGTQLRIAAYGPRGVNVSGLLDQTDLHYIINDALHLH